MHNLEMRNARPFSCDEIYIIIKDVAMLNIFAKFFEIYYNLPYPCKLDHMVYKKP